MGREYVEELKNRVLNGGAEITYDEALKLANEDLDILAASANEIREYFCGDRCDVCSVISVKEGRCTENCRYCAQSRIAKKDIPEINLLGNEAVTEGASIDYDKGSFRYCLVAEGRRLSKREVELAEKTVKDIHDNVDINICASFGLLDQDDFTKFKGAGLTMIHNNLETSPAYFPEVCTSHTQEQKKATIRAAKAAGLMVCSGSLFGMGETLEDRVALAFELRELGVDSVPMNLLNPREGTPFYDKTPLTEEEYVRTIAVYRFVMPKVMIRRAGGRGRYEDNGEAALAAGANAVIRGDFLTTDGTSFDLDFDMIRRNGFVTDRKHS